MNSQYPKGPGIYAGDPGISRHPGNSFIHNINKKSVNEKHRERIRKLVLPPAWTNLWISSNPDSHIQAVGTDIKGNKQYVYHQSWINTSQKNKYRRMRNFTKKIPLFFRIIKKDLRSLEYSKDKLIALLFLIMRETNIRVGNDIYAKKNKSFGLTTLLKKHCAVEKNRIVFKFLGKSNISHCIEIKNSFIIRCVRDLLKFPGKILFKTQQLIPIKAVDMNLYLQQKIGKEFTCKDFRTYSSNRLFITFIKIETEHRGFDNSKKIKNNINISLEKTAQRLGHTKNIAKKSYVSPLLLEKYTNNPKYFLKIKNPDDFLSKIIL